MTSTKKLKWIFTPDERKTLKAYGLPVAAIDELEHKLFLDLNTLPVGRERLSANEEKEMYRRLRKCVQDLSECLKVLHESGTGIGMGIAFASFGLVGRLKKFEKRLEEECPEPKSSGRREKEYGWIVVAVVRTMLRHNLDLPLGPRHQNSLLHRILELVLPALGKEPEGWSAQHTVAKNWDAIQDYRSNYDSDLEEAEEHEHIPKHQNDQDADEDNPS